MKEIKLSPSSISLYSLCPFAYYLRYIQHEQVPRSINLIFGVEIHRMLQEFYKKNFKSADSFVNAWIHRWRSSISGDFLKGKEKNNLIVKAHPYTLKNGEDIEIRTGSHVRFFGNEIEDYFSYKKLGESILRKFYERHKDKHNPIDTERRFEFDFKGFKLRGVIDRIDKDDNGFYVTDYKTDKLNPKENPFVLNTNTQFTVYSLAFRALFNEVERAILFYHLRSGNVIPTRRSDRDFDCLEKICEDINEGILKERFVPHYSYHCNFCDYIQPCSKHSYNHEGPVKLKLEEIRDVVEVWNFIGEER